MVLFPMLEALLQPDVTPGYRNLPAEQPHAMDLTMLKNLENFSANQKDMEDFFAAPAMDLLMLFCLLQMRGTMFRILLYKDSQVL